MQATQVVPQFGARKDEQSLIPFFGLIGIVVLAILAMMFISMQRHLVSDQPAQTSSLANYLETSNPAAYKLLLTHPGRGGTMQCQFAGANPMYAVRANTAVDSDTLVCIQPAAL